MRLVYPVAGRRLFRLPIRARSSAHRRSHWCRCGTRCRYEMFPRLRERRRNLGMQLSGGEQQMLSMARTLLGKPSLLLLDEPLEGLAPVICDELMEMIFHLASSGDITVVLVEQQIERALDFADRVLILERDRQAWLGPSNELRSNRDLVDRLLGVGIH